MTPHLEAPYGFLRHTNDATGKESIYLNRTTNNFLERIKFNYSYTPLNTPNDCRPDYVIPEENTTNSMPNISSLMFYTSNNRSRGYYSS
jgi:hypothetical protein